MRNSQLKEKILISLLESPKTTNEIAVGLGYPDKKGYKNVGPALNTLLSYKFIVSVKEKQPNKPGQIPTVFVINYDISIIRKITHKYPVVLRHLKNVPSIGVLILNEHRWLLDNKDWFEYDILIDWVSKSCQNNPEKKKEIVDYLEKWKNIDEKKKLQGYFEFFIIDTMTKSENMIKLFLMEPEKVKKIIYDIFWTTREGQSYKRLDQKPMPFDLVNTIFEICVYQDMIEGVEDSNVVNEIVKDNELTEKLNEEEKFQNYEIILKQQKIINYLKKNLPKKIKFYI